MQTQLIRTGRYDSETGAWEMKCPLCHQLLMVTDNPQVESQVSARPVSQSLKTEPDITSILLVDDSPKIRRYLKALLETQRGWRVTEEAENGEEALQKAQQLKPDVIIMDVLMPLMNGLDAAEQIRKVFPTMPILMVSAHGLRHLCEVAKAVGARGYVLKSEAGSSLIPAVKAVLRSESYFSPDELFRS
jgi:CheY-like chemotaxis protein